MTSTRTNTTKDAAATDSKSPALRCCLGCGSDTNGHYCLRCIGHGEGHGRGHRGQWRRSATDLPLEDDYSEESDANSVCEDGDYVVGSQVF